MIKDIIRRWSRSLDRVIAEQTGVLACRTHAVQGEALVAVAKLDGLAFAGWVAQNQVASLSEREAQIIRAHPTSPDRAQYVTDKVTQALGQEIDALSQRLRSQ